jgi:hypothetical protein
MLISLHHWLLNQLPCNGIHLCQTKSYGSVLDGRLAVARSNLPPTRIASSSVTTFVTVLNLCVKVGGCLH